MQEGLLHFEMLASDNILDKLLLNMPNEALLIKSSGSLFHILRSAYEGRSSNEPVFKMSI